MAPNPFSAAGKMVFTVVVNTLSHDISVPCHVETDVTDPTGYSIQNNHAGDPNVSFQDAADQWWGWTKLFWNSSVAAPAYRAELNFGGVFVPVAYGTCGGGAGSGAGTIQSCALLTIGLKDSQNFKVAHIFPETVYAPPNRVQAIGPLVNIGNYVDSLLKTNVANELGQWVNSRSGTALAGSGKATMALSKRLRRIRGFL